MIVHKYIFKINKILSKINLQMKIQIKNLSKINLMTKKIGINNQIKNLSKINLMMKKIGTK